LIFSWVLELHTSKLLESLGILSQHSSDALALTFEFIVLREKCDVLVFELLKNGCFI